MVVRTVTTLSRLLDVLSLLRGDHRVQVVFTYDRARPAILGAGVSEALQALRVAVVPWEQALRTRFDLVLAASENDDLHDFVAPVILLPHGLGFQKFYPDTSVVAGLNPDRLVRNGRALPSVIVLSHPEQLERLARLSPEAAQQAVVVGDPCLDRLLASRHRGDDYRAALGTRDRRLVTIASTWGPQSLLGTNPRLPARLVSELPYDETAVCAVLHPGITSAHSPWQIDHWLAEARHAGLVVIPPENGWQAALTAASCVITDEGSLALYSAALDRPLLLAGARAHSTVPDSPVAALANTAPRLRADRPLAPQIEGAIRHHVSGRYSRVAERAVAQAGGSAAILRSLIYDLMRLSEPDDAPDFDPYPAPEPQVPDVTAFVVGARPEKTTVELVRYPSTGPVHELPYRHLVAHATRATLRQLSSAAIVFTDLDDTEQVDFFGWSEATLRRWPDADVVAARVAGRACLARTRSGAEFEAMPSDRKLDPLLAASLVYLGRTKPNEKIAMGSRTAEVTLRAR